MFKYWHFEPIWPFKLHTFVYVYVYVYTYDTQNKKKQRRVQKYFYITYLLTYLLHGAESFLRS